MFKEIIDKINNIEDLLCDYSEMNSFLFTHNKVFMITSKQLYKTPEYKHQPYTFKYGDYEISDYLKNYT